MPLQPGASINRLAVIGNHLPRQCGIATYTTDLCAAVVGTFPTTEVFALAMNDRAGGYAYPERVRFTLDQHDASAYRRAADSINLSNADVVSVQHEYGIFGGAEGADLLTLLRGLQAPIVTTLHTILREPPAAAQRAGRAGPALRPAGGDERARRELPARDLRRGRRQDRRHPPWHPRCAVHRPELPQGPVRCRGQAGAAHLRPALAEQGARARHRGHAGDPRPITRR